MKKNVHKAIIKTEKTPTERAVYYHGLCVHLHIVKWKVLVDMVLDLKPKDERALKMENECINPILTDIDVVPQNLK